MTRATPPAALAVLLLLLALLAPPARADEAADLLKAAGQAHQAGQRCLTASRQPGANQFLENEKAAAHFEQAVRLLERYLEAHPEDTSAEALMQEVTSLLFWCHKMSPMVDPADVEPEPAAPPAAAPAPTTEGAPAPATEAAAPAPASAAEAAAAAEAEAGRLLDEAREHRKARPDDPMGAMTKFFYVAERFPATEAGKAARAEADALQGELFASKPVVPARPKLEPLTRADQAAIERLLRDWLETRRRLRCTSCKGAGSTPCRACDGTGEVRGSAGRRATCTRCRRGKVACERRACVEGLDVTVLEKVVVEARAPYYQETIRALLGGKREAVRKFVEALAAVLVDSPRAPAEISRCATELGIAPVQLRDVIDAHGPSKAIVAPFTTYTLGTIDRSTTYTMRGDAAAEERVSLEQEGGKWYLRQLGGPGE